MIDANNVFYKHHESENFMSVDFCIEVCSNHNFQFAGLQFGHECYCGDNAPLISAPKRECHLKCEGNETQTCGGFWRMNVYSISPKTTAVTRGKLSDLNESQFFVLSAF